MTELLQIKFSSDITSNFCQPFPGNGEMKLHKAKWFSKGFISQGPYAHKLTCW